jgi:hypothetical protein
VEKVIASPRTNWIAQAALVGVLLCPAAAHASRASTVITGPSSMKVKVIDHRGRPVQGAVIVAYVFGGHTKDHTNEQKEFSRYRTDESGEVIIGKLAPGDYQIVLNEDVIKFFDDDFYLKVARESKGRGEFVFHWPPPERVIVTNTLSGSLHKWETTAGKNGVETSYNWGNRIGKTLPVAFTELSLYKFSSGEKVADAKTDGDGRFDLKIAEAGLYYMRLDHGSSEETIVLELDRNFIGAAPMIDVLIEDMSIDGYQLYHSLNGGVIHDLGAQQ